MKLNKANKDILVSDIETVISCLKMKRGFLNKDAIPKPLTKETLFDEDIEYLETSALSQCNRFRFFRNIEMTILRMLYVR